MTKTVSIIGAGIGGIAAANLLQQAGYKVRVYEKNHQPGGRAGILKKDGFTFDTGPSWYLMPDVFKRYYELLGLNVNDQLDLLRLSPAYKVFYEHQPSLTITSDIDDAKRLFESIEPGAGKKLERYVSKSERLYRASLKHFLYSNFTSPRDLLHKNVVTAGPTLLRMAATPLHTYVRSFFKSQRLQQILEYPTVFLGTSPYNAPALYSLMSALDFNEGVFYPRGGMYTIVESLVHNATRLGVEFMYDSPVRHITTFKGTASGITLDNGVTIPSDIVISNADLHFTETQLLNAEAQSYPDRFWQRRQASPSALLMYLGIKGTVPQLAHHSLCFVESWRQNFTDIYTKKQPPSPASMYICKSSATDKSVAPKDHENLFVLVPLPAGIELSTAEQQAAADHYLAQLDRMTGANLAGRIVSKTYFGPSQFGTEFNAWQNTMLGPSHILKQSAFFRTPNKSKKIDNLYYTGAYTVPGIGLPMCLISAELVAARIAKDNHRPGKSL